MLHIMVTVWVNEKSWTYSGRSDGDIAILPQIIRDRVTEATRRLMCDISDTALKDAVMQGVGGDDEEED